MSNALWVYWRLGNNIYFSTAAGMQTGQQIEYIAQPHLRACSSWRACSVYLNTNQVARYSPMETGGVKLRSCYHTPWPWTEGFWNIISKWSKLSLSHKIIELYISCTCWQCFANEPVYLSCLCVSHCWETWQFSPASPGGSYGKPIELRMLAVGGLSLRNSE